jgi:hypothetical protein
MVKLWEKNIALVEKKIASRAEKSENILHIEANEGVVGTRERL